LDPTKTICTRPKQFGWNKIEGQGIRVYTTPNDLVVTTEHQTTRKFLYLYIFLKSKEEISCQTIISKKIKKIIIKIFIFQVL
jgi:hypothetical protein